jgi:hypothetical protein
MSAETSEARFATLPILSLPRSEPEDLRLAGKDRLRRAGEPTHRHKNLCERSAEGPLTTALARYLIDHSGIRPAASKPTIAKKFATGDSNEMLLE